MPLNLLTCDDACFSCVHGYKKKHDLKKGDLFQISCHGIPKNYVLPSISAVINEEDESILSMLDPVEWAKQVLDWHCLDPDGVIWKRKTEDNSLRGVTPYIEEVHADMIARGKSTFNRPYQAEMLRCSAKRKVFRIGRQAGKTEVLCISILYAVFTHRNFNVVIVTPYQAQIDLIFKRLEELIKSNNSTNNSIKRNVKAPNYKIELHNGSMISGFTAGTKSGGNADAVRGQAAQMLVLDEADYLSSGDIASVLSIITNYPNATIWMSSTPTGKREKFYDTCHNPMYREFHFSSKANPLWSDDLEKQFRTELTSIQYDHEVNANFGEQEQGVYQGIYIEQAMEDYRYQDMKPQEPWVYAIGVDWNDVKIGTTICVTGYHPGDNIFKIFTREIVSREGWTQHAACQKIIDLNKKWQPKSIYVDQGYGSTQKEILMKYSWDALQDPQRGAKHPDSRIRNILKSYDFGSKVEIKDLWTRQPVEKAAKPFLIENSVRRFEMNHIKFSRYDAQMEAELRGYMIDHITSTGQPVYKQVNEKVGDHNLDALNLSLVAFTLQMSAFGVVSYENRVAFSGNIGELPKDPSLPVAKQNSHRPDMKRTEYPNSANPIHGGQTALWSWPGWERDAPRPTMGIKRINNPPPVRKKF